MLHLVGEATTFAHVEDDVPIPTPKSFELDRVFMYIFTPRQLQRNISE